MYYFPSLKEWDGQEKVSKSFYWLELSWYLYFYPMGGRLLKVFYVFYFVILHEHGIILLLAWEPGKRCMETMVVMRELRHEGTGDTTYRTFAVQFVV
jgi:hypothetical protein